MECSASSDFRVWVETSSGSPGGGALGERETVANLPRDIRAKRGQNVGMTEKTGIFLVFEGLDGSGKSTLIHYLNREIHAAAERGLGQGRPGAEVVITREPGGTPLAEEIRGLLLRTGAEVPVPATELLLYAASRAQHVAGVIQPALKRGAWVLCDRFTASSVAFQCFARGVSRQDVDQLNSFAVQGVRPHLQILIDVDVAESRRRQGRRQASGDGSEADRMERESIEFHEKVRQGYLAQAKEKPGDWLVVDGRLSPDQICSHVVADLKGRGWLA